MRSCWRSEPDNRPSFTDISRIIDCFLLRSKSDEILHIDPINRYAYAHSKQCRV